MQSASPATQSDASLDYPFHEPPATGALREVAPGVFWLRMPLPFALNHINLWLIADGAGWTAVDCGLASAATREAWERIFRSEFGARPINRLIVTHCHPDHIGLGAWLCERFGLEPWMTKSEYAHAHMVYHRVGGTDHAALGRWCERHGLDPARLSALGWREDHYRRGVAGLPGAFRRIKDREELVIGNRVWRVIVGHGHSPEHAALHCEALGVLISGDMLLPRISTNVSVWPMEPDGDPVGEFLESLERFDELAPDTLVLPSHGLPFHGAQRRIAELREHHRTRLDRLAAVSGTARTAAEFLPELFERKYDDYQMLFALGETIAHLNHLMHRNALERVEDAHGVLRFVGRPASQHPRNIA